MTKRINFSKGLLALLLALTPAVGALAWDTEPDSKGKYDKFYDRPTYFPDWSQPTDWPNNMAYYVCVRFGATSEERLQNYEVAVYDQNDELRFCGRSYAADNHLCTLTIMGTEGDTFHFKVIYGDDFANPIIEDVPDITVPFKTNYSTGNKKNPFWLTLPLVTVLDEKSTDPIVAETNANVRVLRTINANEWGTICLPFAMTEEQIAEAFPENTVQLCDFTGCEVTVDAAEEIESIQVNFTPVTEMEANHPYIIKVNNKVTEFMVSGVDIVALSAIDEPAVYCDERAYKRGGVWHYDYNTFIGNYENGFLVPENSLFLSGGNFWYSKGLTPMMAYRAYFNFYYKLPEIENSAVRISISIIDDTEGITSISREPCYSSSVYTLDGRNVGNESNLRKGIYIINGKKCVIK